MWSGMPPGPAERDVWKTCIAVTLPPLLLPDDDDPLPLFEPLAPDEAPLDDPLPEVEPLPEDEPLDPEERPPSPPDDAPEEPLPEEAAPPEDDESPPGGWAALLQPM
jgi:hypothetical protein